MSPKVEEAMGGLYNLLDGIVKLPIIRLYNIVSRSQLFEMYYKYQQTLSVHDGVDFCPTGCPHRTAYNSDPLYWCLMQTVIADKVSKDLDQNP
jgi:hypothetical protein